MDDKTHNKMFKSKQRLDILEDTIRINEFKGQFYVFLKLGFGFRVETEDCIEKYAFYHSSPVKKLDSFL